ncbi:GNT-I family-domain-containing protein, partial [Pelagophyceae sp. CCMP2097]
MAAVAQAQDKRVLVWRHAPAPAKGFQGTALARISAHVRAALDSAFRETEAKFAILLEDDLRVADDFLRLFGSTAKFVDAPGGVWCVSAWNDNAATSTGWRSEALQRTAYFPGLGWMVGRETWERDLRAAWPAAPTTGWDHWIRAAAPVRRRECLFPEVPRVRHAKTANSANVRGASADRLAKFAFAENGVAAFEAPPDLAALVRAAPRISTAGEKSDAEYVVLAVSLPEQLQAVARPLGMWSTEPRGFSSDGVAVVRTQGATVLVADRRRCEALEPAERLVIPLTARFVAAHGKDVSCDEACRASGMACADELLYFADDCDELKNHFACEAGCGHQLGPELPAYVFDVAQPTHRQCLVSNGGAVPRCAAK